MTRAELKDYAFLSNDDIQRIKFNGQTVKGLYLGEDNEYYLAYEKIVGKHTVPCNAKVMVTGDTYEELEELRGEFL